MKSRANKTIIAICAIILALFLIALCNACHQKRAKSRKTSMPEFEWDEVKNMKNWWKHSIMFGDAVKIWEDPQRMLFPAKTVDGEKRRRIVGHYGSRVISIIITYRGKKVRVISARDCSRKERGEYEAAIAHHGGGIRPPP